MIQQPHVILTNFLIPTPRHPAETVDCINYDFSPTALYVRPLRQSATGPALRDIRQHGVSSFSDTQLTT